MSEPTMSPVIPEGRKTINVTALSLNGGYFVLATCDDGTMWQLLNLNREHGEPKWRQFINPPRR